MTAKVPRKPSVTEWGKDLDEESEEDIEEVVEVQLPQPELNVPWYGEDETPQRKRRRQSDAVLAASDGRRVHHKSSRVRVRVKW